MCVNAFWLAIATSVYIHHFGMPVGMRRDGYETLKRLEKDDNDDNDDKVEVDDSCMIQDWKWVIIVLSMLLLQSLISLTPNFFGKGEEKEGER